MTQITFDSASLAWDKQDGLIPAVVQNHLTGKVLMLGYMDKAALEKTLTSKNVTFFSRSKQALWVKGETSGNFLHVKQIVTDCDQDSLLIACTPEGPSCHLGSYSCFPEQKISQQNFLSELEEVIQSRKNDDPEESYTAHLFSRGTTKMAKKWVKKVLRLRLLRLLKLKMIYSGNVLICSIIR